MLSEESFGVFGMEDSIPATMPADQEHPKISPIASRDASFPFMSLPIELRLKIYGYLLPARHHTIVTQLPHNGFFYNSSSLPANTAQSFYPFGTRAPNNLTTYKVLNTNFRHSFPNESIHPEILRVSRQVKEEAEPVMYGSSETVWDFGTHVEALKAFWGDRSKNARALTRNLRVAKEIPSFKEGIEIVEVDEKWVELCNFFSAELTGLRNLDLTLWTSSGSTSTFPLTPSQQVSVPDDFSGDWEAENIAENIAKEDEVKRWREWEWTTSLLSMEALRGAKITWWGFETGKGDGDGGIGGVDPWIARRMTSDRVVRERMVQEGLVREGSVVLSGLEL